MVTDLFEQKKETLQQIHDLTQDIKYVVEQEDYDQLEELLDKRQSLMNKVNDVDIELQGLKIDATANNTFLNEIKDILKETIELDREIKARLGQEMVSLKQKIKTLRGNKNLKQAYYPQQRQNSGYFIDRKK